MPCIFKVGATLHHITSPNGCHSYSIAIIDSVTVTKFVVSMVTLLIHVAATDTATVISNGDVIL